MWTAAVVAVIVVGGLWLRWSLNGTWRLGPDEALYSTWARHIASGADPWLANTLAYPAGQAAGVDKPPLLMYAIAMSMSIYGYYEFAARFPSLIASTFTILLTFLLARRLYARPLVALLAGMLVALSPFAILYAPTAFADPLMVMWLLLAMVLAAGDHWAAAGLAAALAVLTKQEALLLLPLVAILGLPAVPGLPRSRAGYGSGPSCSAEGGLPLCGVRRCERPVLRFGVVCMAVAAAVELGWEAMRPGQASPFTLGLAHYGGVGLVAAADVAPRLLEWWQIALQYVFASPVLNLALLACAVLVPLDALARRPASRHADLALALAIIYILAARTLASFQLWDRYMLIAAPLLCILLARGVDMAWGHVCLSAGVRGVFLLSLVPLLLVAVLLITPVADARAGRVAVGSDHGTYSGIDETARFVREQVPPGSVIFHYSLGWQLGYYLYGAHLDFWWYPSVAWLAETAAGRAQHSQYIIVPSWEQTDGIAAALAAHGLSLLLVHSAQRPDGSISFRTYRIAPAATIRWQGDRQA